MAQPPDPSDNTQSRLPANPLMMGKIIIAAFAMGVVTFGVAALVFGPQARLNKPAPDPQLPIILGAVMGGLFVLACIFGLGVMSAILLSQARKAWDQRSSTESGAMQVARLFLTRTIIRGAMFEGPGLLGGVILFLTGSAIGIAGLVASLLLLAGTFPTKSALQRFFELATQHEHPAR